MKRSKLAVLAVLAVTLLVLASAAYPAVLYVKPAADGGDDANNGSTWGFAKATIAGALGVAQDGDQVWVKAGTYIDNVEICQGEALYGGFAGTETSLEQRNWKQNVTIIDGDLISSVIEVSCQSASTRIDGFTIRNGWGKIAPNDGSEGGGILCGNDTSCTIANNIIEDNHAVGPHGGAGGGILCGPGADVTIINNIIRDNTASGTGGGIYYGGGTATIANNVLDGNISIYNGAIAVSGPASIRNNTIILNWSYDDASGSVECYFTDIELANNIVALNNSGIRVSQPVTFSHNCVYGNSGFSYIDNQEGEPEHNADISEDPYIIDTPGGNYHLMSFSPCRDAGDSSVVEAGDKDMDLRPRIEGPAVDIGADEIRKPRFDTNDDLCDDLVGLTPTGSIFYSQNKTSWTPMSGQLSLLATGDFNGNGADDIAGISNASSIFYTLNLGTGWTQIPGRLAKMAVGDLDYDGKDDIIGSDSFGRLFRTTDKATWTSLPGSLSQIVTGDFDGDGDDDVAGIGGFNLLYYSTNQGASWTHMRGRLWSMVVGDFNGDGKDDFAGLDNAGQAYFTTDMGAHWTKVTGVTLTSLKAGDVNGDYLDDLIGIKASGAVCISTNRSSWTNVSGKLASMVIGDVNGDGKDDVAGLTSTGAVYYSTNVENGTAATWTKVNGKLAKLYSAR